MLFLMYFLVTILFIYVSVAGLTEVNTLISGST